MMELRYSRAGDWPLPLLSICCVYLVTVQTVLCQDPSWRRDPQPTSVHIGQNATINCEVFNQGSRIVLWQKFDAAAGVITLFSNNNRFNAPDRFHIRGEYNLVITGASEDDNTEFECSVSMSSLRKKVKVTVLVPPGAPVIYKNTSAALKENQVLQLQCNATGGNPNPTISWYRNGVYLPEGRYIEPSVPFGTAANVLTRTLTRQDHLANFSCRVENEANQGKPLHNHEVLNIQYAPIISFSPFKPLRAILGESAWIYCSVDANPTVPYVRWEKTGASSDPSWNQFNFTWASLGKEDSGDYTCVATNYDTRRASVSVDVQYAPEVSVPSLPPDGAIKPNEGTKVNITCNVDANPPVPNQNIIWRREGSPITYPRGPHLVLDNVSRSQTGFYTCSATNQLSPSGRLPVTKTGSKKISVVVQYKPGRATIEQLSPIVKGDSVTMRCVVDDMGQPSAILKWIKEEGGSVERTGPEYTLTQTTLADNGFYRCTPQNAVGDGVLDRKLLTVNERPEWVGGQQGQLPRHLSYTIYERNKSVQCTVRGKPPPKVEWYKDGVSLSNSDRFRIIHHNPEPVDIHSFKVISMLQWRANASSPYFDSDGRGINGDSLRIDDNGNYSCVVTNTVSLPGSSLTSVMKLSVLYPPVLNTTFEKVAIDTNQSATLLCRAHSIPPPTFEWHFNGQSISHGGRFTIANSVNQGQFQYVSVLNITDLTTADLGNYLCVGKNGQGDSNLTIHLMVKTKPEKPTNVATGDVTWESAILKWTAGFDGGYAQTFIIKYTSPTSPNGRVRVSPPGLSTFNVTALFPNSNYTFMVFGENKLGGGPYSINVTTQTSNMEVTQPTDISYDPESRTLKFRTPSSNYCARILISTDGQTWKVYATCAPPKGGSIKINGDKQLKAVKLSLCLTRRQEICSREVPATIVGPQPPDVPVEIIIVVACICGFIVVVLLIILIVLCCRRQRNRKKDYEHETAHQRPKPLRSPGAPGNVTGQPKPMMKGVVNQGLDNIDLDDPTNGGVFATNTSQMTGSGNYVMFNRPMSNGHANGYPRMNGGTHIGNGSLHGEDPPPYDDYASQEEMMNRRNREIEQPDGYRLGSQRGRRHKPNDSSFQEGDSSADSFPQNYLQLNPNNSKEGHSGNESGYSTPDPTKPKKVIYEVIV